MTVSAVTDSQSRVVAYADQAAGRRPLNTASDRNAASSKPMILASQTYVPLTAADIVPTLGDFVDRQDTFNGAVGSIQGDTIKLKADSQTDAGIAITLKKPINGRLPFNCNGHVETKSGESRSNIITVQFIKAGPNYDHKKDEIIDERHIYVCGNWYGNSEGSFKIPEGTDKVVVMKAGESSFDINMSGVRILKPVSIPAEAICKEFRNANLGLQYYPGERYKTINLNQGWIGPQTIEVAKLAEEDHYGYPGDYVIKLTYNSLYIGGPGSITNVHMNLTHGIIFAESSGHYGHSRFVLRMSDKEFESRLVGIIKSLKSPESEREGDIFNSKTTQPKLAQPIPPEIQSLISLLEGYIAKHPETKE